MNCSFNENVIYLELGSDGLTKAIELGVLTLEEAEDAQTSYNAFIAELEAEWPSSRIKELLLANRREACKWCIKKVGTLEVENKEARMKGVSFKDRQHYSDKINTLRKMFNDYRSQGIKWSKQTFSVRQFVKPFDVGVIHSKGFEHHVKYAIL